MLVLFTDCWGSNLSIQAGVGKLNGDLLQPSGIRYEFWSFSVRYLISLAYWKGFIYGFKLSVVVPQAIGISLRNREIPNNSPLKTILTFWLAMNNRLLTWENMRKQGFQGHSLCVLCKSNEEHSSHLFNYCPYVGYVWTTAAKTFTKDTQIINTDITLEQRAHNRWHVTELFSKTNGH